VANIKESIDINVSLDQNVAWQLAQFCKRSTFDQFYDRTEAHLSHEERKRRAYQMIAGIEQIAQALSGKGVSPR
jgi:hypothetical protein